MTSSYLKTSVFARPHEYDESPISKISTLCVDGSSIRRKTAPFSKMPGYVWTGSEKLFVEDIFDIVVTD